MATGEGSIARCVWQGTEFYAMPVPNVEPPRRGYLKVRALTKGPRFGRGDVVVVSEDEIKEWVTHTPDMPVEPEPTVPNVATFE